MAGRDIITMSQKELKQLHVIHKVCEGGDDPEAGSRGSLVKRAADTADSKADKSGGRQGDTAPIPGQGIQQEAPWEAHGEGSATVPGEVPGFGPTLMAEKLREREGIEVSKETVRCWLIEAGQWQLGRKSRTHRQWRERKGCFGQMLQLDGSHHDWFEGRRQKCVLMAYIDDATSKAYGRFYEYEGTIPAMDSFKRYIRKYGIPMSVYTDKHTTYKSPAEPSVEERVNGSMLIAHHDVRLPFREITARPEKQHKPTRMFHQRKGHTPSADHPWKKCNTQLFKSLRGQGKKPMEVATL